MCSVVDGAFLEEEVKPSEDNGQQRLCQKCKEQVPIVTLRKKDVYCKDCFLHNCNHKFRSTLGKNKAIKINDQVLVAFSGSHGSLAILKLIQNSFQDKNNPKKIQYHPHIFIIDETEINPNFDLESILKTAQVFEYPLAISPISAFLNLKVGLKVYSRTDYKLGKEENHGGEKFQKILGQIHDASLEATFLKDVRLQIISVAAKALSCNKIFSGESATSLAISLLSGVAMGRGAQVANQSGFCDFRSADVQLLRPLREFSVDEVAFFNKYQLPEILPTPHVSKATAQDHLGSYSIEKLTETFVLGLQSGFPSTVPTIFRTGDKLRSETVEESVRCSLCLGTIDVNNEENRSCTALEAVKFSKLVSEQGPKGLPEAQLLTMNAFERMKIQADEQPGEPCGQGMCAEGSRCKSGKEEDTELFKGFCYSCWNVLSTIRPLPSFLVEEATKKQRQREMKAEIQDFLIE